MTLIRELSYINFTNNIKYVMMEQDNHTIHERRKINEQCKTSICREEAGLCRTGQGPEA
ncbi:hypothetical protein CE91St62_16580 [Lachnospiraceae bacterium]|nr:hypothetical protein CE91St61_16680 [Lachnospiraceae bacterium]BDF37597.1 hypothetical protein CE91St62_16580 [Lachnospiraceae bacterium]